MAIFYKAKHAHTIWPSTCTLGRLSQRNENATLIKNVHAYSEQFYLNNPKLEITQMSFSGWMVKHIVVRDSCATLLSNEKGRTHISWKDFGRFILGKGHYQKVICCMISFYITVLKWQNYRNREQTSGIQGLGREMLRNVAVAMKGSTRIPWDGTVLYVDSCGDHTYLHMWHSCVELQTYRHNWVSVKLLESDLISGLYQC